MSVVINTGQPFAFTPENEAWARGQIAKYPPGRERSAILALLSRAQDQNAAWLSQEALEYVGTYLNLPFIRVLEVATFYSMFNLKPVGKHLIEICTTTPCWLRGSSDVVSACEQELGISIGETTKDGQFTLREVECLGACVNAPVCMAHKKFYEDLTPKSMKDILRSLKGGEIPKAGPQIARQASAPVGGPSVLKDMAKA